MGARYSGSKGACILNTKVTKGRISLGPEMKSTGEVLGVGKDVYEALYKGFLASDMQLEKNTGVVLATVNDHDKEEFLQIAKGLAGLGYSFTYQWHSQTFKRCWPSSKGS